jgi:hypothetical protein
MRPYRIFVALAAFCLSIVAPATAQSQTTSQVDCTINNMTPIPPEQKYAVGDTVKLEMNITNDPGPDSLLSYYVLNGNRLNDGTSRKLDFTPTSAGTYDITGEFVDKATGEKLTVKSTLACSVTLEFVAAPEPPPTTTTTTVPVTTTTTVPVTTTTTEPPATTPTTTVVPQDTTPTTEAPATTTTTPQGTASQVNVASTGNTAAPATTNNPVAADELPRTGMNGWPLFWLAALGIALVASGFWLRRFGDRKVTV